MDPKKKLKKCGKNKTIKDEISLKKKLKKILQCKNINNLRDIIDLPEDADQSSYENNYTSPLFENDGSKEERKRLEPVVTLKKSSKSGKTAKIKEKKTKSIKDVPVEEPESAIKYEEIHETESEMMNVISEIVANSPKNETSESQSTLTETSNLVMETPDFAASKKKRKNKKKSKKVSKLIEDVLSPSQLIFEPNDDRKKEKNKNVPKRKHTEDKSIVSVKTKKPGKDKSKLKMVTSSKTTLDDPVFENNIKDVTLSDSPRKSEDLSNPDEIFSSYSDNSDEFDVNRSLAGKIIKKIESKKNETVNSKIKAKKIKKAKAVIEDISYESILNKYEHSIQFPPKLEQNIDYVSSVLEVFSVNSDRKTSATISMASLKKKYDNTSDVSSLLDNSGLTDDMGTEKNTEISCGEDNESNISQPAEEEGASSINLFIISNFCIAILKANTKTYFCGKLKVSVLKGSVEVLGHKLTEKQCELYSLSISSLLSFETSSCKTKNSVNLKSKLVGLGLSDSTIGDILEQTSHDDSVLVLRPHNNVMTDFIKKHFTTSNVFYCGKLEDADPGNYEANKLLECKFYSEVHPGVLSIGETWHGVANDFAAMKITGRPNSAVICGGKNSGKSTFLQYLVNKTLKNGPVLVIDLDPGQPEFTIAGVISATVVEEPLLGPNFTHLKQPHRCLCLGLLNVTENAERYLASVKDLINYYSTSKQFANIPWIINTMGFSGNLGMNLLANIMNVVRPRIVVELISQISRNNFHVELSASNLNVYQEKADLGKQSSFSSHDYTYYRLEPFQSRWDFNKTTINKKFEAKSERLLNVLAYFSRISTAKSLSVLELTPYAIPMAAINLAMNNIIIDHTYVASILNGRIVALCSTQYSNAPLQNKIHKLGTSPTICHGYGIIRGIDCVEKMLYVLTPIEPSLLASVNTLVYAESLPDCHLLSIHTLPPNTRIPYTTPIGDEIEHRHLMKTPKRKFNPFQLLEIKRRA